MSNIAIVAIPSKTDQVWGISSEKVPHMTLIHLGEALPKTDFQKVADWIEHVADTMLHPFWMQVSERSTLGKKDADVLFFKPDEDSSIQLFRKYLLANTAVREAFETVDQFEGWTPHLTLGYPETPAKKTAFDHEFYGVSFNKIALWVGDYEGPEFQLKEQEDMAIAMSEEAEEFLAHFGVKGMKWGVRKSALTTGAYGSTHGPVRAGLRLGGDKRPSGIDKVSAAYNNTLLGKVTTSLTRVLASGPYAAASVGYVLALAATGPAGIPVATGAAAVTQVLGTHSLVAAWSNKDNVRRINNSPKYKNVNLKENPKLRKEYHKDQMDSFGRAMFDPRGMRLAETKARVSGKAGDTSIVVRPKDLLHADDISVTIDLIYNELGHIVEFSPRVPKELRSAFLDIVSADENQALSQSDLDELDAFLAHVGVKGMKWGVRRSVEERRADRTARVQARAEKSIARSEQYTARATAKAAAAKAKTETAKAKTEAATAKLETKLAKEDTKLAKTEARTGKDDPSNGRISDRDSGVVGNSNRQAKNLRDAAIKDVRTLDDQTLKAYTERLNTEKKLKDTIKQDQAPGRTATKKLIADAGKDVAKTALIGLGSMAVYYALAKVGAKKGRNDEPLIDFEGMGSTTTKGKSNTKDAFTTAAKEAAKRKAAADAAAKDAADAASSWKPPKSKYPNAIPITGRASPNTNPPPPSGYRKKPGFDPDNWDLRPGKKP
mgnify:CR=1 FL=1